MNIYKQKNQLKLRHKNLITLQMFRNKILEYAEKMSEAKDTYC